MLIPDPPGENGKGLDYGYASHGHCRLPRPKRSESAKLHPSVRSSKLQAYMTLQVPFRETHHISGRAVALAEQTSMQISDLTMEQWKSLSPHFTDDVQQVFDFEVSVEKRNAIGGPAREMIQRQVGVARSRIEGKE
jgi:argininosuccinate lyase